MIKQWSFSRLELYKSCAYHAKLKYVDKSPELDRPDQGKEPANTRGSRLHEAAEHYVNGSRSDLIFELGNFERELNKARELFQQGLAVTEQLWLFDYSWTPLPPEATYDKIWLRVIADLTVWLSPTELLLVDYKSGKRDGNEIKHGRQLQLYQLVAFMKYPQLDHVTAELWYLDKDDLAHQEFTRAQGLRFLKRFNDAAVAMCEDTTFAPRPSTWTCRFCPYGPVETSNKWVNKSGACPHGV